MNTGRNMRQNNSQYMTGWPLAATDSGRYSTPPRMAQPWSTRGPQAHTRAEMEQAAANVDHVSYTLCVGQSTVILSVSVLSVLFAWLQCFAFLCVLALCPSLCLNNVFESWKCMEIHEDLYLHLSLEPSRHDNWN